MRQERRRYGGPEGQNITTCQKTQQCFVFSETSLCFDPQSHRTISSGYSQKGLLPWNHEYTQQMSQHYDYDMQYLAYCGPIVALKSLSVSLIHCKASANNPTNGSVSFIDET